MRQPTSYEKAIRLWLVEMLDGFRFGPAIDATLIGVGPVGSDVELGVTDGIIRIEVLPGDTAISMAARFVDEINLQSRKCTALIDGLDPAKLVISPVAPDSVALVTTYGMFALNGQPVPVIYARQNAPRPNSEIVEIQRGKSVTSGTTITSPINGTTGTVVRVKRHTALLDVILCGPRSRDMADSLSFPTSAANETLNGAGVSIRKHDVFDSAAALSTKWEDRCIATFMLDVASSRTTPNTDGFIDSIDATGYGANVTANTTTCP